MTAIGGCWPFAWFGCWLHGGLLDCLLAGCCLSEWIGFRFEIDKVVCVKATDQPSFSWA